MSWRLRSLVGFVYAASAFVPSMNKTNSRQACANQIESSSDPYLQMCYLIRRNGHENDVHYRPPHPGFHNHITYEMVAAYKLGADAEMLAQYFDDTSFQMAPAFSSTKFITESNWRDHIGDWEQGNVPTSSVHYADYLDLFRRKIQDIGEKATVEWALPQLVNGIAGDLLHPLIQLGYYFETWDPDYESGDDEVCAEGLAWMATGYETLAPLNPSPAYSDIRKAMQDLHQDARLPSVVKVPVLKASYADIMAEYDLLVADNATSDVISQLMQDISLAALDFFAVDGYRNFFILHLVTGSRALQMILSNLNSNPATQALALRRHWSTVLYYFVECGRPEIRTPDVDEASLPAWTELAAAAIPFFDSHLVKMVYLARENHKLWGIPQYHLMASQVVKFFQAGNAGFDHSGRVGPSFSQPKPAAMSYVILSVAGVLFIGGVAGVVLFARGRHTHKRTDSELGTSLENKF